MDRTLSAEHTLVSSAYGILIEPIFPNLSANFTSKAIQKHFTNPMLFQQQ